MVQATYDDANLILKLYELRREETLRKARAWFVANFNATSAEEMMQKYPFGSQENTNVRMVIGYWEMACSFVTAGVLNQELLFQSGANCCSLGENSPTYFAGFRQASKNPHAWGNTSKTSATHILNSLSHVGRRPMPDFKAMIARITASAAKP